MHRIPLSSFLLAFLVAMVLGACAKSPKLEFTQLKTAFQSAPSEVKNDIDQAVSALTLSKFPDGLASLRNAARQGRLNTDQVAAIYDMIKQVQIIMSEDPDKASEEAYAVIRDLGHILEGQQQ